MKNSNEVLKFCFERTSRDSGKHGRKALVGLGNATEVEWALSIETVEGNLQRMIQKRNSEREIEFSVKVLDSFCSLVLL